MAIHWAMRRPSLFSTILLKCYTEQSKARGIGRHGGCHPSSDGVTSPNLEAPAVIERMAGTLAEVETETLAETLGNMNCVALVDRQGDTLARLKAKTLLTHRAMCGPRPWLTCCLTHLQSCMRTLFATHYAKWRTKDLSTRTGTGRHSGWHSRRGRY